MAPVVRPVGRRPGSPVWNCQIKNGSHQGVHLEVCKSMHRRRRSTVWRNRHGCHEHRQPIQERPHQAWRTRTIPGPHQADWLHSRTQKGANIRLPPLSSLSQWDADKTSSVSSLLDGTGKLWNPSLSATSSWRRWRWGHEERDRWRSSSTRRIVVQGYGPSSTRKRIRIQRTMASIPTRSITTKAMMKKWIRRRKPNRKTTKSWRRRRWNGSRTWRWILFQTSSMDQEPRERQQGYARRRTYQQWRLRGRGSLVWQCCHVKGHHNVQALLQTESHSDPRGVLWDDDGNQASPAGPGRLLSLYRRRPGWQPQATDGAGIGWTLSAEREEEFMVRRREVILRATKKHDDACHQDFRDLWEDDGISGTRWVHSWVIRLSHANEPNAGWCPRETGDASNHQQFPSTTAQRNLSGARVIHLLSLREPRLPQLHRTPAFSVYLSLREKDRE